MELCHRRRSVAGCCRFEADSSGTVSDVRGLGRPDNQVVLSGHGGIGVGDAATTQVPEGTCVAFYCTHGETITDGVGNAIETGAPSPRKSSVRVRPCLTTGWNLLFKPDLNIEGNPITVTQSTQLSELLQPNTGICNWAACREVG
jgi:hypothetical protein